MDDTVIFSLSALVALIPGAIASLRREARRDGVFWALLGVALAGAISWAYVQFAGAWRTGLSASLWVTITALGEAAHAGDPDSGDNAIERMMRLLAALQRQVFDHLGERSDGDIKSTVNIGTIQGGRNLNVVPGECAVEIDRRLVPGETADEAFEEIQRALDAAGEPEASFTLERLHGTNGFKGAGDGPGVGAFRAAIEARTGARARFLTPVGACDGRYFADDGIEIINVGPGTVAEGHAANESVSVMQLVDAAVIHFDVVKRLLGFKN